jgi:hypothetical protein
MTGVKIYSVSLMKSMAKRKVFTELMEGVAAMQAQREGKATLRSQKVKPVRRKSTGKRFARRASA